jgi:hypothetical protein
MTDEVLDSETYDAFEDLLYDLSYLGCWVVSWAEAKRKTIGDWLDWCGVDEVRGAMLMLARAPLWPRQRKALAWVFGLRNTAPLDDIFEDEAVMRRATARRVSYDLHGRKRRYEN